jgi:hypothetical protein
MTAIQKDMEDLLKRCLTLHGTALEWDDQGRPQKVPADKAVRDFLTTMCKEITEGDAMATAELIQKAWAKDPDAVRSLNGARVYHVGNFIAAESMFRQAFFQIETLQLDEEPWIINDTENEMPIVDVSPDGAPQEIRVIKSDAKFAAGLYVIVSRWVKYNTLDIYKGDVSGPAKATFNIARDLAFKLDRKHFDLLNASAFGPFSVEQDNTNPAERIYLAHSGIVTSNLPSTNDFDNDDVAAWDPTGSSLTGFRPEVLALIGDYSMRWGTYLPDTSSRLVPTGDIIIPSQDISAIAKGLLAESGTNETDLQKQIQQNGYASLRVLGQNYRFLPNATIESGTCYPVFNLKVGLSFDKPGFSADSVENDLAEHWERRKQGRAWGATLIKQWRVRAMRINYTSGS